MQIRNHIVYYLLSNPQVVTDAAIADYTRDVNVPSENTIAFVKKLAAIEGNKNYYITNTILEKTNLLKANYNDWSVLDNLPDGKYTFIFKNDSFLRFIIEDRDILFYSVHRIKKGDIRSSYFYHSFHDGTHEGDFYPSKELVFKLLCFFFFSKNEEKIVNAGKSYGTKKQHDAISNDTSFPITIVNSNWNVTSIRNEGFNVSGHFRLQPCGEKRSETKMIFIEPFKKHGYIRKAINKEHV